MAQLKAEAAARDLSITRLARDAHMSRSSLDLHLKGRRQMPLDVFYNLCSVIGVDPVTVIRRAHSRLIDGQ
ncbi:MAG: helix-turn-helix transcriptional regulator [Propionibacteriaceae bacterium]|nr:helix-turn-helix transcriptional regulator [Propionibacteriaceae bacterium]